VDCIIIICEIKYISPQKYSNNISKLGKADLSSK